MHAVLLGRDHALLGRNRQDHAVAVAGPGFGVAVVADGCGEGEGSEVGARVSAIVASRVAAGLLSAGAPLSVLAERVGGAVLTALHDVAHAAAGDDERAVESFACEHLAATLWIAAAREDRAVVFGWGYGLLLLGDRVEVVDEAGHPRYLVRSFGATSSPAPSAHIEVEAGIDLAVATDGWDEASLREAPLRGTSPALLRWMRLRQRQGAFADDAAVSAVHSVVGTLGGAIEAGAS